MTPRGSFACGAGKREAVLSFSGGVGFDTEPNSALLGVAGLAGDGFLKRLKVGDSALWISEAATPSFVTGSITCSFTEPILLVRKLEAVDRWSKVEIEEDLIVLTGVVIEGTFPESVVLGDIGVDVLRPPRSGPFNPPIAGVWKTGVGCAIFGCWPSGGAGFLGN